MLTVRIKTVDRNGNIRIKAVNKDHIVRYDVDVVNTSDGFVITLTFDTMLSEEIITHINFSSKNMEKIDTRFIGNKTRRETFNDRLERLMELIETPNGSFDYIPATEDEFYTMSI